MTGVDQKLDKQEQEQEQEEHGKQAGKYGNPIETKKPLRNGEKENREVSQKTMEQLRGSEI